MKKSPNGPKIGKNHPILEKSTKKTAKNPKFGPSPTNEKSQKFEKE